VPLLQIEIQRHEKSGKEPAQAIRFENAAGLFYDRGVILSQDAHQIVYRSLDDSITVAYMDRLITTEEYYEWLARKPSPPSAQ
jgi:hypothetical protein